MNDKDCYFFFVFFLLFIDLDVGWLGKLGLCLYNLLFIFETISFGRFYRNLFDYDTDNVAVAAEHFKLIKMWLVPTSTRLIMPWLKMVDLGHFEGSFLTWNLSRQWFRGNLCTFTATLQLLQFYKKKNFGTVSN